MSRRLGVIALVVLILGIIAASAARLLLPPSLLQYQFTSDPAITLLITAIAIAAILFAVAMLIGWQQARTRRSLQAQALVLDTERRRFIQRLDHELKNPLTAIQVQLDNLQASPDEGAIISLRTQADRLSHLTRGLRRLADLETRPLEIERIDIGELLSEAQELLQSDRLTLDVQKVPWPIPPVEGDRELLLIVFRNLADNALKYSTAPVHLRARHTSGALVVEVIDTGRGISPEELPLVTEELYRGSNTRDVLGSGLGLAMVNRIVERHNGKLELRSRTGQGTIATLQLPYEHSKRSNPHSGPQ
jgi:two-component system, OmpR family, sensor kinase